jgi:hypothetical protein
VSHDCAQGPGTLGAGPEILHPSDTPHNGPTCNAGPPHPPPTAKQPLLQMCITSTIVGALSQGGVAQYRAGCGGVGGGHRGVRIRVPQRPPGSCPCDRQRSRPAIPHWGSCDPSHTGTMRTRPATGQRFTHPCTATVAAGGQCCGEAGRAVSCPGAPYWAHSPWLEPWITMCRTVTVPTAAGPRAGARAFATTSIVYFKNTAAYCLGRAADRAVGTRRGNGVRISKARWRGQRPQPPPIRLLFFSLAFTHPAKACLRKTPWISDAGRDGSLRTTPRRWGFHTRW